MIIKLLVAGTVAFPAAMYVTDSELTPKTPDPSPASFSAELEALRESFEAHRAWSEQAIEEAESRALSAEARVEELSVELDEYWDAMHQGRHGSNCTPSRDHLVRYRRLQEFGSERRAEAMLTRMFDIMDDDTDEMNQFAWTLLTDRRYEGKYDDVAMHVARHMQEQPENLDHQMLDTIALAFFKNDRIDEAISLQERAIAEGGRRSDYKERLSLYKATRKKHAQQKGDQSLLVKHSTSNEVLGG